MLNVNKPSPVDEFQLVLAVDEADIVRSLNNHIRSYFRNDEYKLKLT